LNLLHVAGGPSRELGNKPMIKFGLKPAMTMSLADSDNPVEQLNTIIDFAKAARDAGFHSIWAGQHYFGGNRIRWEVIPLLARLIPEVKDSLVGTCILLLVTDPIVPLAVLFKCHGSVNPDPQHINVEALSPFQVVYRNLDMINALEIDFAHGRPSFLNCR
jgi:hypothetical protein